MGPEPKSDRQAWFRRRLAAAEKDMTHHQELLVVAMRELEAANADIACYQGCQSMLSAGGSTFETFFEQTQREKVKKHQAAKINKEYHRRRLEATNARYNAVLEKARLEEDNDSGQVKSEPSSESRSPSPEPSIGPELDLAGFITPEATPGAQSPVAPLAQDDEEEEAPAHGVWRPYNSSWKALSPPTPEVEPAPAAPVAATRTPTNNVPVTATIEQVIANVSRPAGSFLNTPQVHSGFSRVVISKVIGGSPQGTWPNPMAVKDFPYKLQGCAHYICIKSELNQWLPTLPGTAGALTLFRDDGSSKAAHNTVYPLFICRGANDWAYFGHYRAMNFPTTNGEVPANRFRQFSASKKRKWCRHILSQQWGREHLLNKGIITTAQAKLKNLMQVFPPEALMPHFERPDSQKPLRLQLRLLEPVLYDDNLYNMLIHQSQAGVLAPPSGVLAPPSGVLAPPPGPLASPSVVPQRRHQEDLDDAPPTRRQRIDDDHEDNPVSN
jgi:hypothetical protein